MSDILMDIAMDDLEGFWQLYKNDLVNNGLHGSLSDFLVWLEEEYPEEYARRFEHAGV